MKKHIILDTDIWGDPDDVFALMLALNSPEIVIDLIVTSDEHKGHRALYTQQFLKTLGYDIPVVQGKDIGSSKYCMVCDQVSGTSDATALALTKMVEVVERNDKTYFVCIGPQTNLADLLECVFEYYPELIDKLEVLMMGGAINYRKKNRAEHNIRLDVKAALKVFASDVKKRYVISDTTFNTDMEINRDHPIYGRILNSDSLVKNMLIASFENFFQSLYPRTIMHDPLTLSCLIDPKILTFEEKKISMNEAGIMKLSDAGKSTIVSVGANYGAFMQLLSDRLPF